MNEEPLTDEQAQAMLARLKRHFKQPVMPINVYCDGLRTWQRVLDERAYRVQMELYPGMHGEREDPATQAAYKLYKEDEEVEDLYKRASKENRPMTQREYRIETMRSYRTLSESVSHVFLQITKSNLLARLLYAGEKLRTKMCPIHKGTWSGIEWGPDGACPHKCQLTGWIQEETDTGKPLPGVFAVKMTPTGEAEGEVVMVKSVTGEVMGKAVMHSLSSDAPVIGSDPPLGPNKTGP